MRAVFATLFILLLFLTGTKPVWAGEVCTDGEQARQVMLDFRFQQMNRDFSFDLCDEKDTTNRVTQALVFLKNFPKDNLGLSDFNANVIDKQPYDFFKERVKKIVLETLCPESIMAYVMPQERATQVIHICPMLIRRDAFYIALTLMHESRHMNGFPHVDCNHGPQQSISQACDSSYQEGGSYGVGTEFAVKAAKSHGLHPALVQLARAQVATDFLTRYNEMPLGLKQGVILQKRNGEISFYGGQQLQKFPLIASEDSLLTQRLGDLTLYDREKVTVQSYSVTAGLRKAGGDFAQQFQTTFSQQERQNLIDVYYGNDYACFLFPQELRCSADSEIRKSLPANMVPVALIQNSSNKILSHSGVYLSTRDGSLYQLPAKFSDLQALDPSQWSRTTQPYRLLNLGIIDRGQVIALTQEGKVMTYSAASQQWSSDAALEKSTFVKMLAPFLWSKRLNDL